MILSYSLVTVTLYVY